MDFTLMITSLPKLLGAAVVTLKLLSLSLFFGLFILGISGIAFYFLMPSLNLNRTFSSITIFEFLSFFVMTVSTLFLIAYLVKLNIPELDQYFNIRLPQNNLKVDNDFFSLFTYDEDVMYYAIYPHWNKNIINNDIFYNSFPTV